MHAPQVYEGQNSLVFHAIDRHTGISMALKLYKREKLSEIERYQVGWAGSSCHELLAPQQCHRVHQLAGRRGTLMRCAYVLLAQPQPAGP